MKSFKADILSISPSDKGLTLKTSRWKIYVITGHEIAPNTGTNATKFFTLATKS